MAKTAGVVDVDWYREDDQQKVTFAVDSEKAALPGSPWMMLPERWQLPLAGRMSASCICRKRKSRSSSICASLPGSAVLIADLASINLPAHKGACRSPSWSRSTSGSEAKTLYRKNLKDVVYVIGDVAGEIEAPVYAILKMQEEIAALPTP